MHKQWHDKAWEEYLEWQHEDRKTLDRINKLLMSLDRNGINGIGKAEPLKGNYAGYWSVRIDKANRLIFKISENRLIVVSCKGHYE